MVHRHFSGPDADQLVLPLLQKNGLWQAAGAICCFQFHLFDREWFVPVTATVLLSFVASLVSQLI